MALLSKIQIGGNIYDIKDAVAREAIEQLTGGVEGLGTAASLNYAATVTDDNTVLPTGAAIVQYVGQQIADINSFEYEVVSTLPTASADTMYTIYLLADTDANGNNTDVYEEWITIKTGDAYSFEKIGDTNIGLNGYVPTSRTVAGLALSNDITADALKTALGLGALAYKNTITGTVEAVTAVGDIDYTPTGEVFVGLKHTNTAVTSTGKFTPTGNVSGSTKAAGEVAVGLGYTATPATLTQSDYTPAGTVSVSLSGNTFNAITHAGTQASYTEGAFTPASLTYNNETSFAVEGLIASMGVGENSETLILSNAATTPASVITAFSGGSKEADQWTPNTVATYEQKTVGVQSASFAGTTAEKVLVTAVNYEKANVQSAVFTGQESEITATFAGTEGDVNVSGNYAKAEVESATFTGTQKTLQHEVTKGDVEVKFAIN